ncbi:unnamed protein product [Moneuplotes crassus]|uniref:Uncharacterized protein n=1 Tax=Euplotes crassus TaxID=5936 RepID=A0AAD1XQE9_EUPCR|nr:unnamed protein product [Moneuplotes crassus]
MEYLLNSRSEYLPLELQLQEEGEAFMRVVFSRYGINKDYVHNNTRGIFDYLVKSNSFYKASKLRHQLCEPTYFVQIDFDQAALKRLRGVYSSFLAKHITNLNLHRFITFQNNPISFKKMLQTNVRNEPRGDVFKLLQTVSDCINFYGWKINARSLKRLLASCRQVHTISFARCFLSYRGFDISAPFTSGISTIGLKNCCFEEDGYSDADIITVEQIYFKLSCSCLDLRTINITKPNALKNLEVLNFYPEVDQTKTAIIQDIIYIVPLL